MHYAAAPCCSALLAARVTTLLATPGSRDEGGGGDLRWHRLLGSLSRLRESNRDRVVAAKAAVEGGGVEQLQRHELVGRVWLSGACRAWWILYPCTHLAHSSLASTQAVAAVTPRHKALTLCRGLH